MLTIIGRPRYSDGSIGYIEDYVWITVNDVLVMSEVIRQWFSGVTESRVKENHWLIIASRVTKTIIHSKPYI